MRRFVKNKCNLKLFLVKISWMKYIKPKFNSGSSSKELTGTRLELKAPVDSFFQFYVNEGISLKLP